MTQEKPPYNTYYQLDEDGEVVRLVPFKKWAKPAMVHDFSITENYAVFFEASLYIDPPQLLKGQPLFRSVKTCPPSYPCFRFCRV